VSVFSEIRHAKIFLTLTLTLFRPKGPSSPLLRRLGIAWASAPVRNRSFSQQRRVALFRIRSKVFSVAQDSDVLKICEIKANRSVILGLAI
jgi:hypothetical protein